MMQKKNSKWSSIQGNKKTNDKGTQRISDIAKKANDPFNKVEYGFTQEKDGTVTDEQTGEPTNGYKADIKLKYYTTTDILIHSHKTPTSPLMQGPIPVIGPSKEDVDKYDEFARWSHSSSNAIVIQPTVRDGVQIYFHYSMNNNFYKISLTDYIKSVPIK